MSRSARPPRLPHPIPVLLPALLLALLALAACSKWDAVRAVQAAASGNPTSAFTSLARSKAVGYASNPQALVRDVKRFVDAVEGVWGSDAKAPTPKQYVKYTQDYRARALVDFDAGVVSVETVDARNTLASLQQAVVTTLLTPNDPRGVDLYSAGEVALGGTPFLLGEVKDADGRDIATETQAKRFAETLVLGGLRVRRAKVGGHSAKVWSVQIPMVRDHLMVRAAKFRPQVLDAAQRFGVSPNLVCAVINTESDFNPFAVSSAGAVGLMQVVPSTAGADVCRLLNGRTCTPAARDLTAPGVNITYGTAYLHLLLTRHFGAVGSEVSREYLSIAAYNGGPGAVRRVFGSSADAAVARMNAQGPSGVYSTLRRRLPARETRDYLDKVLAARKLFVNF
ncbi:MAG: murein transglycosylase domain-containing protein [Desulfovibrionaceae bacterium]